MPDNHRQKVHDNGSLEIHQVESSVDEGFYTCLARNKQNQQSESSLYISIKGKLNFVHDQHFISTLIPTLDSIFINIQFIKWLSPVNKVNLFSQNVDHHFTI